MRRSWPQRLVLLVGLFLVAGCFSAAFAIGELDETRRSIGRYEFPVGIENGLEDVSVPGQPVNILMVGVDDATGIDEDSAILNERTSTQLTDAILILRLDPRLQRAYLLSLPRDLWVDYAGGGTGRINAAFAFGGANELQQTVTEDLGIPIHRFIEVNFVGFTNLIDAIGGVEVYFENPARSTRSLFDTEAGCQTLDGGRALAYVRARSDFQELIDGGWSTTGNSDFDRMTRQQQFLTLVMHQVVDRVGRSPQAIINLLDDIGDSDALAMDSQTSLGDLKELATAFADFNPDTLQSWTLGREYVTSANIGGAAVLELNEDAADPILRVFRGYDGVLTPADIALEVSGDDPDALNNLDIIGFDITETAGFGDTTTIRASVDQLEPAELVASWLADLPAIEIVAGEGVLSLHVGNDDPDVLVFGNRNDSDFHDAFNQAVADAAAAAGDAIDASLPGGTTTALAAAESSDEASDDSSDDTTTTAVEGSSPDSGSDDATVETTEPDSTASPEALLPGECPSS